MRVRHHRETSLSILLIDINQMRLFYRQLCVILIVLSLVHSFLRHSYRQKLQLKMSTIISPETTQPSDNFLQQINQYGANRMARRAVGVLQKMSAYRQGLPSEVHFTAG